MKLEPCVDLLARIAALLGFVEGLSWAVLSFTAIIVGTLEPDFQEIPTSYTELVRRSIFERFLKDSDTSDEDTKFTIAAFHFSIFMWIYFILSICWIAISLDQFTAVIKRKNRHAICMLLWGGITTIISLLDLIFFALLLSDYYSGCPNPLDVPCHLSTGIVMTIAARGFTLWVVNTILSFLLIKIASKILERRNHMRNILESDYSIPRAHIPKSMGSSRGFSQESTATAADVYNIPPTVKKGNDMYY